MPVDKAIPYGGKKIKIIGITVWPPVSTEEKKIIRKTTENVSHPLTPSTVMKAYDAPSIVLYAIGTTTKVQDTVPTYNMLTHCGNETRKWLEKYKKIQNQPLCMEIIKYKLIVAD